MLASIIIDDWKTNQVVQIDGIKPSWNWHLSNLFSWFTAFQIREESQVKNLRKLASWRVKLNCKRRFGESLIYLPLKILHWLPEFASYVEHWFNLRLITK